MTGNWNVLILWSFVGALLALVLVCTLSLLFAKPFIKWILGRFVYRIVTEPYHTNIWEAISAVGKLGPKNVVENSLRAEFGGVLERPFGSTRKWLNFDGLVFSPAQLADFPAEENAPCDITVVIGPKAKKPLQVEIPLLVGGMGYCSGISKRAKIALAKGAEIAGTASNGGEGGFLPEERAAVKRLILQYSSAAWTKDEKALKQADAVEIRIGQGARPGAAAFIASEWTQDKEAQRVLQVREGEVAVIPAKLQEVNKPRGLKALIDYLRDLTDGVPVGVKFCPTAKLEADMEVAVEAGVDFISIDGAQGGTTGAPTVLEDDFGLPTIYALPRAAHYLKEAGVKEKISLLVGGGLFTPGDCLKALALGADAVYIGTAALWAMAHTQVIKVIPWEPPTQLVYYPGSAVDKFDIEEGARSLGNFLHSLAEEIGVGLHALGKTSLAQLNAEDLVALDEWTSKVTRIPLVYDGGKLVKGKKKWADFFPG